MSKIEEDKKITIKDVIGYTCDYCARIEKDSSIYDRAWLGFSLSHQAWGYDSCESRQDYDVCSPECFLALGLQEGNRHLEGYSHVGAEIAEMPWDFFKKLAELGK